MGCPVRLRLPAPGRRRPPRAALVPRQNAILLHSVSSSFSRGGGFPRFQVEFPLCPPPSPPHLPFFSQAFKLRNVAGVFSKILHRVPVRRFGFLRLYILRA